MTLVEQMRQPHRFTETERHIIQFLLLYPEKDMTITQLAKETYTSNATIIRLCRKLGFQGYRQFKTEFIKQTEAEKYQMENVDYSVPFENNMGISDLIRQMGNLYKESADICMQLINPMEIRGISAELLKARRIFIFAIGDSLSAAKAFAYRMAVLGKYFIFPYDTGDYSFLCNVGKDDCVMFISYGFKAARFLNTFDMIREKTKHVITITAREKHLITQSSRYKVVIAPKEGNNRISTFYSQFVFEFILNLIFSVIFQENYNENVEKRKEIDRSSYV